MVEWATLSAFALARPGAGVRRSPGQVPVVHMTTTPSRKARKPKNLSRTPVVTTDDEVRWYVDTIVRPTVKECVDHQDDVRLAVLAATVVSHLLTDYMAALPSAGGPKLTTNDLLKACPPLRVVHDVCNATKHVRITRYLPDISPETLEAVQSGVMEFTFGPGLEYGATQRAARQV
jgi:hypothetical protein